MFARSQEWIKGRRRVNLTFKGKYRDLCGDRNVLFDYINVSITVLSYPSFPRRFYWGKLGILDLATLLLTTPYKSTKISKQRV